MVTYFGWKSIHYWKRIHTRSASSQDLIFETYAFQILRRDLAIFHAMSSKFRGIYMSLSYCNFYDMSQNLKDTSPNLATCCNVLAMLCDIVPHVLNFCDMLKIKWKNNYYYFLVQDCMQNKRHLRTYKLEHPVGHGSWEVASGHDWHSMDVRHVNRDFLLFFATCCQASQRLVAKYCDFATCPWDFLRRVFFLCEFLQHVSLFKTCRYPKRSRKWGYISKTSTHNF